MLPVSQGLLLRGVLALLLALPLLSTLAAGAALARTARGIFETSWNAPTAAALANGITLAKRVHAETPPPGSTNYGE